MTLPFTWTPRGHCRVINWPNFNIVVSQRIGTLERRERDGEQLVSGAVRTHTTGTSLVVQWLRLHVSAAGGVGSILVGKLKSHMLWGAAKKNPNKQTNKTPQHLLVKLTIFFFFFFCIYLFLAALGLRYCVRASSSCGERGLLFVAVRRLLIAAASLVAEHGL